MEGWSHSEGQDSNPKRLFRLWKDAWCNVCNAFLVPGSPKPKQRPEKSSLKQAKTHDKA